MWKSATRDLCVVVLCLLMAIASSLAWAQSKDSPPQPVAGAAEDLAPPKAAPVAKPAEPEAAKPRDMTLSWQEAAKTTPPPKHYTGGDLWNRSTLSGDWGGLRNDLAMKGLTIDFGVTQTLQGNLGGGKEFRWPYQGSEDLFINIDTGKMGLWPGGFLKIHAENRWGNAANLDTGALLPVNTDSLFPVPGQDTTTLSEVLFMQFLSPQFGLIMGKIEPRENNVFARDETTQFMNAAFVFNPAVITTLPQDFLTVGAIAIPTNWLTVTVLVLDSEGQANTSGFDPDTAFHRGTTVYNNWEFTIKPLGQTGHQRISWTWSDKSRVQFEQDGRLLLRQYLRFLLGLGPKPTFQRSDNDWSVMYDFDQFVYTVKDHPDRGFGFFGRFGFTPGVVNPIQDFYSFGVGAKGLSDARPRDSFGVGYYYLGLSDKLPRFIQRRTEDEKGVELYYNFAVTPWMHITPDLQIIDPAAKRMGITTVFGIRLQMDF